MTVVELLVLGVVIAANNMAVALALGALKQYARRGRIILVFGLFEFFVPLLGITLGQATARWVEQEIAWAGALLLILLGGWTLASSMRQAEPEDTIARRITTWTGLAVLAAGLSLDNLLIGFSLGLGTIDALLVATTMCFFSVVFTWTGLYVGYRVGDAFRHYLTTAAGILLIVLGVLKTVQWI
ncbi:MAG: manganese efflux pump [Longimonas sp.]|uniref:manganese efflux pump MntP n=1 Tax=Longimonas sp. TaxID=2039626 RepID=UPI00335AD8BA